MRAYVESDEIPRIRRAASNMRDETLILFLSRSGCRISEALALCVEDIDFDQCTVTIKHLKRRLKLSCPGCGAGLGATHAFCPKCGVKIEKSQAEEQERRRQRVLPLDDETLDMLRQYIQRGGPVMKNGKQMIFGINRHRAWQVVTDCAKRAGLPKVVNPETGRTHNVSPHRLRDAFAVMAIKLNDTGDGLRMLQEHLGHQSFNTTARYRKVAGEEHRDWYRQLWKKERKVD